MSPNITARSLVGMSEAAKRRAARAQFVEFVFASQGTEIKPGDKGPRWFHLWCRGLGDVASRDPDYAELRSKYRLGERLRPCPGCSVCEPLAVRQLRGWVTLVGLRLIPWKHIASEPCNGFTGRWSAGWTVHLQNGERIGGAWRDDNLSVARETAAQNCLIELRKALGSAPHCDGSGVLPARRSK